MKRYLIAAMLAVLIAAPAFAGSGLTPDAFSAGNGIDWIRRSDGTTNQTTVLQVAYAYYKTFAWRGYTDEAGLDAEESVWGVATQQRVLVFPGNDGSDSADWMTEVSLDGWYVTPFGLEVYAGAGMSIWGANIDGEGRTLGGPRVGFRWSLDANLDFEAGGRHYIGPNGTRQSGVVFGPVILIG